MKAAHVLQTLDVLSYKPGYTFHVTETDGADRILLRVTFPAPNARTIHHPETDVSYTLVIEPARLDGVYDLQDHIYSWLARLERHELLEWLAFGHVRYLDPHAPGVDPDGGTL